MFIYDKLLIDVDELPIDAEKVPLIEGNKERLEHNYSVKLEYGLKATDNITPKQWITIKGQNEDRSYAKVKIHSYAPTL